jgi:hypothetical protein
MSDSFSDRMNVQRVILKQINQVKWPREELFSLSEDAIQRWMSVNRLGDDYEVARFAREAGDALLFLANASQEQVSSEYVSRSANVSVILERIRTTIASEELAS